MEKEEEVVSLEFLLSSVLRPEKIKLNDIKGELDSIAKTIGELNKQEESFLDKLSEIKRLNNKLLLFFERSNLYNGLFLISQSLSKIESEYSMELSSFRNEVADTAFSKSELEKFYKRALRFLLTKISLLDNIESDQKETFESALVELKSAIDMVSRLLKALIRKAESSPEKYYVKESLNRIQDNIRQIEDKIPLEISDLYKREDEYLKGLYNKAKMLISEYRESLRKIAVENSFLEEIEISILETIYRAAKKEFEFNEVIRYVEEKIQRREEIQKALINLSEKGFLFIKIFMEQ